MAVLEETRTTPAAALPVADPAPLGLAAFALTTFILSGHNASFIPDVTWIGLALFYGGLVQLLAGMWEFRNRNVFGATAFSTYGGFWMSLGVFVILAETTRLGGALTGPNLPNALAWFLVAFAFFNTYMLLWSSRVSLAVFGVFLTLELTEIVLAAGFFYEAHGHANNSIIHAGGWIGVLTAAVAWCTSAALVSAGMNEGRALLPVGRALWTGDRFSFGRERQIAEARPS